MSPREPTLKHMFLCGRRLGSSTYVRPGQSCWGQTTGMAHRIAAIATHLSPRRRLTSKQRALADPHAAAFTAVAMAGDGGEFDTRPLLKTTILKRGRV